MSPPIRNESCWACPYRRDVPSGVWDASEYDKLARYDAETFAQPFGAFHCHAAPELLCHGWVVVHARQVDEHEPMAFRIFNIDPTGVRERVPLFGSGTEAAEHGKREIEHPSEEACRIVAHLLDRYPRLREGQ
jgi:hypothetical protein